MPAAPATRPVRMFLRVFFVVFIGFTFGLWPLGMAGREIREGADMGCGTRHRVPVKELMRFGEKRRTYLKFRCMSLIPSVRALFADR